MKKLTSLHKGFNQILQNTPSKSFSLFQTIKWFNKYTMLTHNWYNNKERETGLD